MASLMPLTWILPSSVQRTQSLISWKVASVRSTSPGVAALCMREATFTTSPKMSLSLRITWPVFSPMRAWNFSWFSSARARGSSASTTMNPMLCRWRSYSRPGLPSPQMSFMGGS